MSEESLPGDYVSEEPTYSDGVSEEPMGDADQGTAPVQPARPVRYEGVATWPLHLEPEQFDELVTEVMDGLPREWSPLLDNMAVVVEEEPSADDIPSGSPPGTTLFGLYRGAPVPAQFLAGGLAGPAMGAPPEIALFQGPLERASSDLDDLRARVRHTLIHEIGHHFGYSEARLREEDESEQYEEDNEDDEDEQY